MKKKKTFIARLLENNKKLDNVFIIALPFENEAAQESSIRGRLSQLAPKTPPIVASAALYTDLYTLLGDIFRPLLTRKL